MQAIRKWITYTQSVFVGLGGVSKRKILVGYGNSLECSTCITIPAVVYWVYTISKNKLNAIVWNHPSMKECVLSTWPSYHLGDHNAYSLGFQIGSVLVLSYPSTSLSPLCVIMLFSFPSGSLFGNSRLSLSSFPILSTSSISYQYTMSYFFWYVIEVHCVFFHCTSEFSVYLHAMSPIFTKPSVWTTRVHMVHSIQPCYDATKSWQWKNSNSPDFPIEVVKTL